MKVLLRTIIQFLYCAVPLLLRADDYSTMLNAFKNAQKAVIFDTMVGDIGSENACAKERWNNIQQYVCRCCIVSSADKIPYEKRDGNAILEACKKEGACTDALIQELKREEELEQVSDTDFVNILYDRSLIIKKIDIADYTNLYQTGSFSEETLKRFLVRAYNEHKILDPAFSDVACLSIKSLVEAVGSKTGQLFLVRSSCNKSNNEYIFKEILKSKDEIFGLSIAAHYKPLKPYIYPNKVKDFPIIELPIAYLRYASQNNKRFYISIMHKAHGIEFLKLMDTYATFPTEQNKNILQSAYASLGRVLANFHKKFMRNPNTGQPDTSSLLGNTILHGSLHPRNYFYENNTIYWIDNETIGKSIIKPQSIYHDLYAALFYVFKDRTTKFKFDYSIRDNPEQWFKTFYPYFFNAYLDTWAGDKKAHISELITILNQFEDKKWVNYCNVILDKLIKQ